MTQNVHRNRRQGSPAALVASLFGMAGRTDLPGPALVALLGDLGLRPDAARRALARMREAGQLATTRRGRQVDHHLAGAYKASVLRLRDDRGRAPAWDGSFHTVLHHVPESARSYRDRLRRAAVLVGYGPWQPGVLLCPVDRSAGLQEVLAEAPADASVVLGRLVPDDGWGGSGGSGSAGGSVGSAGSGSAGGSAGSADGSTAVAAEMARRAWSLDEVAVDLRAHVARLDAVLGRPVPDDGALALRRLSDATGPVYVDLLRDPGLPVELLPADWPGRELRQAIGRVAAAFLPTVVAYVHERIAAAD